MSNIKLIKGDCLEQMDKLVEQEVQIDLILTDIPYGTTACKWDTIIPFDKMWIRLNKLIKDNGAILLFGSEPFSSNLRMSNIKNYKYDWYWDKENYEYMVWKDWYKKSFAEKQGYKVLQITSLQIQNEEYKDIIKSVI